jgi:hypothetical protein
MPQRKFEPNPLNCTATVIGLRNYVLEIVVRPFLRLILDCMGEEAV